MALATMTLQLAATAGKVYATTLPATLQQTDQKTIPASKIGIQFVITAQAVYGPGVPVTVNYHLHNSSAVGLLYEAYNLRLPIGFTVHDAKN